MAGRGRAVVFKKAAVSQLKCLEPGEWSARASVYLGSNEIFTADADVRDSSALPHLQAWESKHIEIHNRMWMSSSKERALLMASGEKWMMHW